MYLSVGNGHRGVVKLLLERGAEGQTPYRPSLARGYREIADLLRAWRELRKLDEIFFCSCSIALSDMRSQLVTFFVSRMI